VGGGKDLAGAVLPAANLRAVISTLKDMSQRKGWRQRQLAARGAVAFAPFVKSAQAQDELSNICVGLMRDRVSAVRVSASEALCATAILDLDANDRPPPLPAADAPTRQVGADTSDVPPAGWGDSVVIPHLYNMMQKPTARERLLGVHMVETLVSLEVLAPDVVVGVLVPLVLNASSDELPNVRLAAARALSTMVPPLHEALGFGGERERGSLEDGAAAAEQGSGRGSGSGSGHAELERCLVRLATDRDYDVIHFAHVALAHIGRSPPAAPGTTTAGSGLDVNGAVETAAVEGGGVGFGTNTTASGAERADESPPQTMARVGGVVATG